FASIHNLAHTLSARLVHAMDADQEEDLILMVAAMSLEAFSKRLSAYPTRRMVMVVGDRKDIQALAVRERVRVVVVTGGLPVEEDIIELAKTHEVCLLISPHDSATTAMLSRASITVKHMIH